MATTLNKVQQERRAAAALPVGKTLSKERLAPIGRRASCATSTYAISTTFPGGPAIPKQLGSTFWWCTRMAAKLVWRPSFR